MEEVFQGPRTIFMMQQSPVTVVTEGPEVSLAYYLSLYIKEQARMYVCVCVCVCVRLAVCPVLAADFRLRFHQL